MTNLSSIFIIATKRLYAQKGLALATLIGLVVAVALTMSIPLYADAVYFKLFKQALAEKPFGDTTTTRPPFAFMFRYIGAWRGVVEIEETQALDQYLSHTVKNDLGLNQQLFVRHFKTDNFRLFPQEDVAYADTKDPLTWISLGFITDVKSKITLLEGAWPTTPAPTADSVVDVLIKEELATQLGLQVGETFIAFNEFETEGLKRSQQLPIRIAGVWQTTDPSDSFWFYSPSAFESVLLVPEESFIRRISPYLEKEVYLAVWYLIMDDSKLHANDAGPILTRIKTIQQKTSSLLPDSSLDVAPTQALQQYQQATSLLTVLLYAFSVPILILILTFVSLVVNLTVSRQRNEIAVLRSRGATALQVVSIALLEGILLGGIALILGVPLGEGIAWLIGQTRSFLNFSAESNLRIATTPNVLQVGLVTIALALVAQLIPTIEATRYTIVTYKQERARSLKPPWWQRIGLDGLLLLPAIYGTYLLQQQGSILLPSSNGSLNNDPFQNPLLLLIPALGIFALTLFFLRLLPYVMRLLTWIASKFSGVSFLLATRQLARMPGFYTAPMVLLILTLSLSAFTASLAQTLDNHLFDQIYYKLGATMHVVELGESTEDENLFSGGFDTPTTEEEGPRWLFLPVSEYLKVSGVQAAARVGRYKSITRLSQTRQEGSFLGVDRLDFPQVAFWRWDFSPSHLNDLMNTLALYPEGVLVPRRFMRQHALKIGDTIQVNVNARGEQAELSMKVVGAFDLFPTWYPEDGPLFVGNLEYLFEQFGTQVPYSVWLNTDANTPPIDIITGIRRLGLSILSWEAATPQIIAAQQSPERQGLFGILSVGFGAAALLTILGFMLYAFFSFKQRFIELGVLRAIGLSAGQMTMFLAWELAFLILTGLVLGTGLGAWVSYLFIPYLQVGTEAASLTPPFLVEIAWPAIFRIYVLFGGLFVVALASLVILLLRMKVFQALKLGETV